MGSIPKHIYSKGINSKCAVLQGAILPLRMDDSLRVDHLRKERKMNLMIGIIVVVLIFKVLFIRKVIIFEYEKAVKYVKGKYSKILEPGKYYVFSPNVSLVKVDIRPKVVTIPGQEVLSSDGVTVKISLAAEYEINAPYLALNNVEDYRNALYMILQLAIRDIINNIEVEQIIVSRGNINKLLLEKTYEKILEFGLRLKYVGIKDIMFPGELKKIFSQVIQARKEGLASLEKARGETAALRSLANASKLLENNPALMKLKLLQSTGNTLVVGLSENMVNIKGK